MCSGRILGAMMALATAAGCGREVPRAVASRGCPSDLRLLLGACVTPAIAAAACGASSIATLDGCAARAPCEPGRARDLATGDCLPRRDLRTLAASLGILVGEDETLVCPGGGELATGEVEDPPPGPRLGCLPPPAPREPACAAGTVRSAGGCLSVVDGPGRIDVGRWLLAAVGPDGGAAAPPLCRALRQSAGALAAPGTVDLQVEVALAFPDNDVTQVSAVVRGSGAATVELERAVAPMVEALRSLGGTANQASIATIVQCRRTSERPAVATRTSESGESQIR